MKWRVLPQADVAADIVQQLNAVLESHEHVLLLVSGGSAIPHEANVLKQLSKPERILGILPVDERFGESGHPDSNMAQLRLALPLDTTFPLNDVLEHQDSLEEAVRNYGSTATDLMSKADAIVAILGMGADAHTAGVLPGSPATDSEQLVIGYDWSDYQRMTLGATLLQRINKAFVIVYGDAKHEALQRLHNNSEPVEQMPAKLLYDIGEVTIYNEVINEG